MPIYLILIILALVMLFFALTFTIAVTMVGWALRERESEWPAESGATAEAAHADSTPRVEGEEAERETASGAHSAA